jgi:predicted Zn-dependent peptidase
MCHEPEKSLSYVRELLAGITSISREEFEFAKEKLYRGELFGRESGEAEADGIGFAGAIVRDDAYYEEFFTDLKKATYEEFLRAVSFLSKEPLTGYLLPQGT